MDPQLYIGEADLSELPAHVNSASGHNHKQRKNYAMQTKVSYSEAVSAAIPQPGQI